VDGKEAVAVETIKRSGEKVVVRSHWGDMGGTFDELVEWFQDEVLPSRFAYDVASSAYALQPGDMFQAELRRLVARHRDGRKASAPDPQTLAERLNDWATRLPEQEEEKAATLANWVLLARFVAQGGVQ